MKLFSINIVLCKIDEQFRKVCLCLLGVDGVGKSTVVKAIANG